MLFELLLATQAGLAPEEQAGPLKRKRECFIKEHHRCKKCLQPYQSSIDEGKLRLQRASHNAFLDLPAPQQRRASRMLIWITEALFILNTIHMHGSRVVTDGLADFVSGALAIGDLSEQPDADFPFRTAKELRLYITVCIRHLYIRYKCPEHTERRPDLGCRQLYRLDCRSRTIEHCINTGCSDRFMTQWESPCTDQCQEDQPSACDFSHLVK